jgi:hypothetical protein
MIFSPLASEFPTKTTTVHHKWTWTESVRKPPKAIKTSNFFNLLYHFNIQLPFSSNEKNSFSFTDKERVRTLAA